DRGVRVSGVDRLAGRVHGVRVAAPARADLEGRHLRVREPGDRDLPRLGGAVRERRAHDARRRRGRRLLGGGDGPQGVRVIWVQRDVRLSPVPRGFHLVTREVESAVPELSRIGVGLAHVFIRHTSASLSLNENASADVRRDFETWFTRAVPDGASYFTHTLEGDDDMPAHIKASLLGSSLSLPIRDGAFALGTWQGIYLCEPRD